MNNTRQHVPIDMHRSNVQHPHSHYKSKGCRVINDDRRNELPNTKFLYEDSPGRLYKDRYERSHQTPHQPTNDSSRVKWSRNNIAMTMEYFEPITSTPKRYSSQSDYSYAYYEPGAIMHHSNVPKMLSRDQPNCSSTKSSPKSIRSLLSKPVDGKTKPKDRHTYTTRYGTQENIYEDVSSISRVQPMFETSVQSVSGGEGKSKIEFQDILHNHYRVLEELNLSVEELFLTTTKKSNSLSPRKLLKRSTKYRNKTKGSDIISCKNVFASSANELMVAEDSGFSGSSSGASYVGSLRNYKTALTRSHRNSREIDNFTNENDYNTSQGSVNVKVPSNCQKISFQVLNQLKGEKNSGSSKGFKFPFWSKR